MLELETRVRQVLTGDSALIALCPAANISAGEVWTLPLDAPYPHISYAATGAEDGRLGREPRPKRYRLAFWVETMNDRASALAIADRIADLFHWQERALSSSACAVFLCRQSGGSPAVREPNTGADQVSLEFEVIAAAVRALPVPL